MARHLSFPQITDDIQAGHVTTAAGRFAPVNISDSEIQTLCTVADAHVSASRVCPVWIVDALRAAIHSPDLSARTIGDAAYVLRRIDGEDISP